MPAQIDSQRAYRFRILIVVLRFLTLVLALTAIVYVSTHEAHPYFALGITMVTNVAVWLLPHGVKMSTPRL